MTQRDKEATVSHMSFGVWFTIMKIIDKTVQLYFIPEQLRRHLQEIGTL